ncbi:hypothetical protein MWN34_11820 [Ancylobacter sp. 6x-1]|uniref:Uncharacterized protein n=1 Tax=Ancylobacter crimeensis TaxID=2579147 RepID=A0ABT0DCK3_9HYPH|nr:hypothetical protein [Ancylobacter crimeensis]MCK0197599.1 hypothetical protein [Ancylobacter crimeensis]
MTGQVEDRYATAQYIASLVSELSQIAKKQRFDMLHYLLQMAWQEARGLTETPAVEDRLHGGPAERRSR